MNDFTSDKAFEVSDAVARFWFEVWIDVYGANLLRLKASTFEDDLRGVDAVAQLHDGRTIKLQEKTRREDWPDFLFEYISNTRSGSKGWIEYLPAADVLGYAFLSSRTAYVFDFRHLFRTWVLNRDAWLLQYKKIEAKNVDAYGREYSTLSVAVPIEVVMNVVDAKRVKVVSL